MGNEIKIRINTAFDPKGSQAAIRSYERLEKALASVNAAASGGGPAAAAAGMDRIAASARKAAAEQERLAAAAAKAAQAQERASTSSDKAAGATRKASTEQDRAAAAAAKAAAEQEKAARAAAQAERGALQYAQAQARLQAATKQTAAAEETLSEAIARSSGTSKAALAAQTQLAQMQQRSAQAAQRSEAAMLQLAQAEARAQVAAGNLAGAQLTLSSALARSSGSSKAALSAQAQLSGVQNKIASGTTTMLGGLIKVPAALAGWVGPATAAMGALAAVAVALSGLNSIASGVKIAAGFESSMAMLQASSGASKEEMAAAGEVAKQLGADLSLPATSAASAADAMGELVKGGLSLQQAQAAAKGTLQLAAAGMVDEATAAEYATAALNSFSLSGDKAVLVADQFAAGANATSTDVKGMADALRQGGGLFASYQTRVVGGVEALTQFNTAVGVLATVGIKGTQAGTYIASSMERLANPTQEAKGLMTELAQKIGITGDIAYDAQGKMRPYEQIMRNVALATADMTEKERDATIAKLFLTEGSKAVIPIIRSMSEELQGQGTSWDVIKEKTQQSGAAQALAAAQMAGLNGAIAGLQSQMETLAQAAFEPFLPLLTSVISGVANLAQALTGQVGPAAAALAQGITTVGQMIATVAVPAMEQIIPIMSGVTAAAIAYAAVQYAQLIPGLIAQTAAFIASIPAIAAQTAAFAANAVAVAAAALPYAIIAAAVMGMVGAYQNLQDKITNANQKMLEGKQFWQDSTTALADFKAVQDANAASATKLPVALTAAANTVQLLRDKVEAETRALAERDTAGQLSDEQRAKEMARINEHAYALQQASTNLDLLVDAELKQQAASMDATNALAGQADGIAAIAEQAAISAEDLANLEKEMQNIFAKGGDAMNTYMETESSYMADSASRQEEHANKIAELQEKLGEAKTAKAKEAIQKEIAAAQEGYAAQEAEQAASYARQQAAQSAALGQQLIAYAENQRAMGKLTADQAEEVIAGVEDTFGVTRDAGTEAFLQLASVIDGVGDSGGATLSTLRGDMASVRDQAVDLKQKADALTGQYAAEVLITMKGRPPEEITAALQGIPARVQTIIDVITRKTGDGGIVEGRLDRQGYIPPPSGASKSAGGGTFITSGPTTLTVGDNPGGREIVTVEPIGEKGATVVGPGMARLAGGGTIIADGGPATVTTTAGGGGRRRAGSDPVKEAERTNEKLLKIQEQASKKLADLQAKTSEKLADIDAKYAERQASQRKSLYADMATDHADMLAQMEADDLDFYDKSKDKGDIQQREAAQATYRARIEAAQAEAREIAKTDAQLAKETLAIRDQAARERAALDQRYNEVAAQASKKDRAKLKKEYDEAVAAQEAATNTKLDIAQQEAAQRKQAQEDEKTEVVAGSQEQAAEIINAANEQANAVEGASNRQKAAVITSLAAQQDAAKGWSSAFHNAAQQVISDAKAAGSAIDGIPSPPSSSSGSSAGGSPGGSTQAAGGGTFITSGPTTLTVGDNPGGREIVQVTPLGGSGATRVGSGMARMAGGGTLLTGGSPAPSNGAVNSNATASGGGTFDPADVEETLKRFEAIAKLVDQYARRSKVDPGIAKKFGETTKIVADGIGAAIDLRKKFRDPGQPFDLVAIRSLVDDVTNVVGIFQQMVGGKKLNVGLMKAYAEGTGAALDVIEQIADFRKQMQGLPPAVELELVRQLAAEVREVTRVVQGELVKLYQEERDSLKDFGEAFESAADVLNNAIDLRDKIKDVGPPLMQEAVLELAREAETTLRLLVGLQGISASEATALADVAEQAGTAADLLSGMADLREKLAEPTPPISAAQVADLAREALLVRDAVLATVPTGAQTVAGLEGYATAVEQAAGVLQRLAELRETLSAPSTPIDLGLVDRLAGEARRVVIRIFADAIPYAEQQVAGLQAYVSVNEGAVSILQGMSELAKTLAEPTLPITDKVVDYLAAQARRVATRLFADAIPYTEQQLAGFEHYASVVQGSIDTLSSIAGLGESLSKAKPINDADVRLWAAKARTVAGIVLGELLPVSEAEAEAFARYADTQGRAVDIVSRTAGLGEDLKDPHAIDDATIREWAAIAKRVLQIVQAELAPTAEAQVAAMGRYAQAQGDAVGIISGTAGLGADLKDAKPIDLEQVRGLADTAKQIFQIVNGQLVPLTEAEADAFKRYGDAQGTAVDVVSRTATLSADLSKAQPISEAQVRRVAADGKRILQIVEGEMIPVTEAQAEAIGRFATAQNSAVEAVKSTLGLTANLFADYQSPSDAQFDRIISDADRLILRMTVAAAKYKSEGIDAAKAYAEALGGTVGSLMETGKLIEALKYGNDYVIDPQVLAQFAASTETVIALGSRLGAQAATVDPAGLAALTNVAGAMNAVYESMVKLSAVPVGDLPGGAAGLSGLNMGSLLGAFGGSSTTTTITIAPGAISVYATPGMDPYAIAQQVMAILNQQIRSYR